MAVAVIALGWFPTPAAAQAGITAEGALAAHQIGMRRALRPDCRETSSSDEIVVCGARDSASRFRIPLPIEAEPGARIAGEAPSAAAQLGAGDERCSTVGREPICPQINWVAVGFMVAKTVVKAIQEAE